MWDWSLCDDAGARFENLVASNLLKYGDESGSRVVSALIVSRYRRRSRQPICETCRFKQLRVLTE
ncbi:MAG: hypothetical protein FJ225_02910 [Lentisphaerae bacterium]|nr:hypothetical protein [Lentisphaerota bacterium]